MVLLTYASLNNYFFRHLFVPLFVYKICLAKTRWSIKILTYYVKISQESLKNKN